MSPSDFCDIHGHLYEDDGYAEALVGTVSALGLDRVCIGGGDMRYGLASNETVLEQAGHYPEKLIPFASLDLARHGAGDVESFNRRGFYGLRTAAPPAPYDDARFFPVYEAAEALEMPIMFHTGILPVTSLDRACNVRSAQARPITLDAVARQFPTLNVIGTGLGWPWYEEAVELMEVHRNVYFDLSGPALDRRPQEFFAALFSPPSASALDVDPARSCARQLLFGSACRHANMPDAEVACERLLRTLALERGGVEAIMGGTAARILNL